jgi:hypothetical protein
MGPLQGKIGAVLIAALCGLAAGIIPAAATPTTFQFSGSFLDGGTASGEITINTYGYLSAPTAITTTTDPFSEYTYALPGDPSNLLSSDTILVLSSPTYNRYLYLDFAQPLTAGDVDNLIPTSSFECDGYASVTYACPAGAGNIRYFASGTAVPEPLTLAIFLSGLVGMTVLLGRRRPRVSLSPL